MTVLTLRRIPRHSAIWTLTRMELRAAVRNWWLLLYAAIFILLIGGVALLADSDLAGLERGQFGRTAAALTNIVLLVVPLFGLIAGATTFSGDRESGKLGYLLSQPLTAAEVFWGKCLGTAGALLVALGAGFAAAAFALSANSALELSDFLVLVGLSVALLLIAFSVGVLLSVFARRSVVAISAAVFAWVVLIFIGDLGLMGTVLTTQMNLDLLLGISLVNPTEVFKVAAIHEIDASLDALGPTGAYLVDRLGSSLRPVLLTLLALWIIVPLTVSLIRFRRMDAV